MSKKKKAKTESESESNPAMFRVPETFNIGGMDFRIDLNAEKAHDLKMDGLITFSAQTILLDSDMAYQHTRSVLLHEILHGVMWVAGTREFLDSDKEEQLIKSITHHLMRCLRENDIEWLIRPDEPLNEAKEKNKDGDSSD